MLVELEPDGELGQSPSIRGPTSGPPSTPPSSPRSRRRWPSGRQRRPRHGGHRRPGGDHPRVARRRRLARRPRPCPMRRAPRRTLRHPARPFPDPVEGQAVYDFAGVFDPSTIAEVESTIDAIEQRTGAEVASTARSSTTASTEDDRGARPGTHRPVGHRPRRTSMTGWSSSSTSIRRSSTARCSCTRRPASRRRSSTTRPAAIFDEDMLPHLQSADLDAALLAAWRGSTSRPRRRTPPASRPAARSTPSWA